MLSAETVIQGAWLALGSLRYPKPRMVTFLGPFFRSEWAPFRGLGVRIFDAGAKFRALYLVWALHFRGEKTSKCVFTKNHEITHIIDQQCMSFDTSSLKNASHLRKMTQRKNVYFVEISGTLIFALCFLPSAALSLKKIEARSSFSRFLGPLGTFYA